MNSLFIYNIFICIYRYRYRYSYRYRYILGTLFLPGSESFIEDSIIRANSGRRWHSFACS